MTPLLITLALMFQPMGPPPTPLPISPAGREVISQWQAKFDAVKREQEAAGPPASSAEAVGRMARLDREGDAATAAFRDSGLSPDDMRAVQQIAGFALRRLAHENVGALKKRLPPGGWFRISRDGAEATHDAWWIVWRSDDREFAEVVLKRMAPLARRGEVSGQDYARLFDRTAIEAGRPQAYGTYWSCREGVMTLPDLAEPAKVDRLRARIRWSETFAETKARLKVGEAC